MRPPFIFPDVTIPARTLQLGSRARPGRSAPLSVGIIGTRGIPNAHGGFEQFVENLVRDPLWSEEAVSFRVYGESVDLDIARWARAVHIPIVKRLHPVRYYVAGLRRAMHECDVVFCCGVGIGAFALLPRIAGIPLVLNPDGCEWRRSKWSGVIRFGVRLSYAPAMWLADRIILDAEALREDFGRLVGQRAEYIGYQAPSPGIVPLSEVTRRRFALHRPFVLVIARLEPENSVRLAVEAMRLCEDLAVDLIIIGPTTTPHYRETLAHLASPRIRFLGGIYEQATLDELRGGCVAYVHGHTVGGTNPSLLEALARASGPIFCHENKYNREVAASGAEYFGTAEALAQLMRAAVLAPRLRVPMEDPRFTSRHIAHRYLAIFRSVTEAD